MSDLPLLPPPSFEVLSLEALMVATALRRGTGRPRPGYGSPEFAAASEFSREVAAAAEAGAQPSRVLLREPRSALRTARMISRLPVVELRLSSEPAGRAILAALRQRRALVPTGRLARAVLCLPATVEEYLQGKHRQAVRTNVRRATERGVRCRAVDDVAERVRLARAVVGDRSYDEDITLEWLKRTLRSGRFLVAEAGDGAPLAFVSLDVDVRCAYLRAFMTSRAHEDGALARYPLHVHAVTDLTKSGVTRLVADSALRPPAGVQYFQHLVGFTVANVRVRRFEA